MNEQENARVARLADLPQLLGLMKELAAFEGYLPEFAVDERALRDRGFDESREPQFAAFVAERGDELVGYAVVYKVPFTYTLKPTLVLKELFIREAHRARGHGQRLLALVTAYAEQSGCDCIRWAILPENHAAKRFYKRWSGEPDGQWQYWKKSLNINARVGHHSDRCDSPLPELPRA